MLPLTPTEIFLRLGAAFLAGALLGLERETHGRPAGLRTTILTCVAAAAACILAHEFAVSYKGSSVGGISSDPGRLVAGVLTGIGFLGAGTIIRHGSLVRGVTTAAVLWLSTIVGLVFGGGEWALGFGTMVFAALALAGLPSLEDRIDRNTYATLSISTQDNSLSETELRKFIEGHNLEIQTVSFNYDFPTSQRVTRYHVKFKASQTFDLIEQLPEKLRNMPGIIGVSWE